MRRGAGTCARARGDEQQMQRDAERSAKGGGACACMRASAPLRWALPWPRWPSPHKERRDCMHQATMGRREGPASSAGIRRTKVMMHHLQPSRHAVRRRRGCALGVGSLQGPKGRPR